MTVTLTRPASSVSPSAKAPACVTEANIFLNPLLEDGIARTAAERREQRHLAERAEQLCGACPLQAQCLWQAVVQHDVSGFVAGTTPTQRQALRRELRVRVESEDFSDIIGSRDGSSRVSTDEVLRAKANHPDDSLQDLAIRLNCSLSTIKRHLRRDRDLDAATSLTAVKPTVAQVMAAWRQLRRPASLRQAA